ncbi:MBL fold metallo-hydrolase [Nocardioides sp. B-3]|nr:MBL fold metallo-hydrolase [Nocardioides sp. B-3]UUZ61629.1 MBL fold metallo-hydrolase [Nocardioides sp. B-3]
MESHPAAVSAVGQEVVGVLLTHHHLDHSEAAREFASAHGCGVRALDPAYRLGSEGLGAGDVVTVGSLEVHVVATPGHTADSLSFVVPSESAVLTGDTVLGRGTTVVAHPDGSLGAYLSSLDRLHALCADPGHHVHLAGPRTGHLRRAGRVGLLHRPSPYPPRPGARRRRDADPR